MSTDQAGHTDRITGFHAHVYCDDATRPIAARLRGELGNRFDVLLGRWHDKPAGPHPQAMYRVAFAPERLGSLVPWLMLNRETLDILVHAETGDAVADHTRHALWLGHELALDLDALRRG